MKKGRKAHVYPEMWTLADFTTWLHLKHDDWNDSSVFILYSQCFVFYFLVWLLPVSIGEEISFTIIDKLKISWYYSYIVEYRLALAKDLTQLVTRLALERNMFWDLFETWNKSLESHFWLWKIPLTSMPLCFSVVMTVSQHAQYQETEMKLNGFQPTGL